jgi:hypothetical protein
MKIQTFIFNWKRHEANAAALEEKIARLAHVVVINSEEGLSARHPGWIHLDDSAYFSEQWNKAIELFNGDLLFHIQADVEFDRFDALFARVESMWTKYTLGIYEPDIRVTIPWFRYDKSKLQPIEPDVFEIPMADCTCWFIDGQIVRKFPRVDVSVNKFGWGICGVMAALSQLNGRRCIRDYRFTVSHPRGRGYSSAVAEQQRDVYIKSLAPELANETFRLDQLRRSAMDKTRATRNLRSLIARSKTLGPIARRAAALLRERGYLPPRS